jgi:hypothetical protein
MQMIRALEPQARGVYCGALGVVRPGEQGIRATFNVPIRTVTLCGTALRCGMGSGITADARADGEWREWQHKRAFVERASRPFDLLETLALEDGRLRDAPAHLARMAAAARSRSSAWKASVRCPARASVTAGSTIDIDLALKDASGAVVVKSDSIGSNESLAGCLEPGTYYLHVYA